MTTLDAPHNPNRVLPYLWLVYATFYVAFPFVYGPGPLGLWPHAAGLLIFLQGVAQVCRCLICIRTGAWPGKLEDVEELEQVLIKEHEATLHGDEAAHPEGPAR